MNDRPTNFCLMLRYQPLLLHARPKLHYFPNSLSKKTWEKPPKKQPSKSRKSSATRQSTTKRCRSSPSWPGSSILSSLLRQCSRYSLSSLWPYLLQRLQCRPRSQSSSQRSPLLRVSRSGYASYPNIFLVEMCFLNGFSYSKNLCHFSIHNVPFEFLFCSLHFSLRS